MPDDFALGDGGFAKIYGDRLADSSLLECAVATRWCFLYMLARADSEGRFRCATVRGLTRAAAVTLEEAEHAIAELEAPDPDSTTPDEGGRRIVRIPGGWRIVAKAKYRDFRTRRQIDAAQRQRARRERLGGESTTGERDMSRVSHDVTVTCTPEARGQRPENNGSVHQSIRPEIPRTLDRETRIAYEREVLALVGQLTQATGKDPDEILSQAKLTDRDKRTGSLNPASWTDERLRNTRLDLRANLRTAQERNGS